MASVPRDDEAFDVAIFCLALMGTDYMDYIREANRILKPGGALKIAEIVSRIKDNKRFIKLIETAGFKFVQGGDKKNNQFFLDMEFKKVQGGRPPTSNESGLAAQALQPCIYKKR